MFGGGIIREAHFVPLGTEVNPVRSPVLIATFSLLPKRSSSVSGDAKCAHQLLAMRISYFAS